MSRQSTLLMWTANLLTLARLPLAVLFWFVVHRLDGAFAVIALAALTDVVDGRLARRARRLEGLPASAASMGAWLDPLCDKTFVVSVLIATWVHTHPPLWLIVAIGARELVLVPLATLYRFTRLRSRMRYDFRAGPLGKAATVAQFVAILALLAHLPYRAALAWLSGAIGLVAAGHYVRRGLRLARRGSLGPASLQEGEERHDANPARDHQRLHE